MTALNPIALNPIGLQFLNPIVSTLAGGNSFLSLLNDVAGSDSPQLLNNRKQSDPLSAALLNMPPPQPAEASTPLPLKLSLNLFKLKPEVEANAKDSRPAARANAALSNNIATVPSADMLSFTNPISLTAAINTINTGSPRPAVESTHAISIPDLPAGPGLPVRPDEDFAKSSPPRVNAELNPANSTPAPHLAFALRLNPTDQPTAVDLPQTKPELPATPNTPSLVPQPDTDRSQTAKPVQPLTGTDVVAAPAQAQHVSTGGSNTDTNSGNRRPANRQSDANADAAPMTVSATPIHSTPANGSQETPAPVAQSFTPASPSAHEVSTTQHIASTPALTEAPKTGPANQLSFTVSGNDQQKVEVRVMDRAGEVHVSVRTPNEELASTLRNDLGSLTGKLTQSGYTTEAFTPAAHGGELSHQQRNSADQQTDQQPAGGQGRNANRQGQQQDSQQNGRYKRPAWLDELENSMAHAPASKRINA